MENAIGWYHSHPGYGCWLSGIDVSTQMLNQNFQEPFVAIVVDPVRTVSAGKVCLGAFRTYPKGKFSYRTIDLIRLTQFCIGYKPPNEEPSEYQTIPLNKIEDFGVHCKQYYPLDVTYFKSALDRKLLDSLWNKYWVNTLGSSGLLSNTEYTTGQIFDLSEKLEQSEASLSRGPFLVTGTNFVFDFVDFQLVDNATNTLTPALDPNEKRTEDRLTKATRDCSRASIELIHGLMAQIAKDKLFNTVGMKNNK